MMRGVEYNTYTYVGETNPKRIARLHLYKQLMELWRFLRPAEPAHAVVLTGDSAAEYGCLRWVARMKPEHTIFVDMKPEAAKVAHQRWPMAQTFIGDVSDALCNLTEPLAFVHLDFCGGIGDFRNFGWKALVHAAQLMAPGGIVAYSFIRGRESPEFLKQLEQNDFLRASNRIDGLPPLDENRFCAYTDLIEEALRQGGDHYERVFMCRYDSGTTPMGVIAFQKLDPLYITREHESLIMSARRVVTVADHDIPDRMRKLALSLKSFGRSDVIGDILNVPQSSVAAWLAHETRGTYKR